MNGHILRDKGENKNRLVHQQAAQILSFKDIKTLVQIFDECFYIINTFFKLK